MGKTFQELAKEIKEAIQAEIAKISDFNNGAIVMRFVPFNASAQKFLGGFDEDAEIELSYHIKPVGFGQKETSYTRPAGWRGKDFEVNCRDYADLKIGACAYALHNNLGRRASDMPEDAETYGRVASTGCVVYDVERVETLGYSETPELVPFFRIYVAVSGATGEEDEICALAAGKVLKNWCDTELVPAAYYSNPTKYLSLPEPAPLEQ
ncbi:hypothetical protein FWH09_02340 [Candidatus Saccharibacteria bacterium]|nr:hypothetical protein [Candidatus Saccharibacteria bacterium]